VSATATEHDIPGRDVRLRDGLRFCFWVFLAVRVGLSLLSAVGSHLIPPLDPVQVPGWHVSPVSVGWHNLFTATERQDALWFLRIGTLGYAPGDGSAAFFPLYPLLIRIVAWLPGVGPLDAALLISNGAFYAALVLLHGLTRMEFSEETARTSVLCLAIFPTAFFFLAPYTEAPFLLLSIAAFWFARRDRWVAAALAGALAAMTRSVGILILPALVVEAVMQWRQSGRPLLPRLTAALNVADGPLLYLLYWNLRFHDAWAPLHAQGNWGRHWTFPLSTLWSGLQDANRYGTYWLIDALVVGVVVVAVVAGLRVLRPSYLTYAALSLLLPLTDPFPPRPLMSMPRFVAVIFPAFWVIGRAVTRRRIPEPLVIGVFAAGWGLLAVLFINWHYIF
jgi:Mannosyltransferase (PIG-V)